jgi:peptide/nickel transport system ATP-binding protein
MPALLDVQNLHVCTAQQALVKGVSFKLKAGEILAVIGESGSGKSLTSMACCGLLPPELSTMGEVFFDGQEVLSLESGSWRGLRRKGIGVIFQDPMSALNPLMRISLQLAEAIDGKAKLNASKKDRIMALLKEVGLHDLDRVFNSYPYELSGGQQQRIVIAMALATEPRLLIADEPTTALDALTQNQVVALLKSLCEQRNLAVMIVTHDLSVVQSMAHHIAVFKNGLCVEQGATAVIMNASKHEYTQMLVAAAKKVVTVKPMATIEDQPCMLRATNIRYRYAPTAPLALKDVSVAVTRAECLGIVGESGSGKSTLAKILVGAMIAESGQVVVCQRDAAQRWKSQSANLDFARHCQYIFQDTAGSLNPSHRIKKILTEALLLRKHQETITSEMLAQLLAEVELPSHILESKPADLSGGQRQRIVIARALAMNPEVLVCDEPVSALDAHLQKQTINMLINLQRKRGLTLIFIGHDLGLMQQFCDRIAVMDRGQLVEEGPTKEVLAAPQSTALKGLIHHTFALQKEAA